MFNHIDIVIIIVSNRKKQCTHLHYFRHNSLFLVFYYFVVVSPQFDIIENNLGRIFPGLATLLSIAIILNNFVLNQEAKLMVKEPRAFVSEITKILKPFLQESLYRQLIAGDKRALDIPSNKPFLLSIGSNAIYTLLEIAIDDAKKIIEKEERDRKEVGVDEKNNNTLSDSNNKIVQLSRQFVKASSSTLDSLKQAKNQYGSILLGSL